MSLCISDRHKLLDEISRIARLLPSTEATRAIISAADGEFDDLALATEPASAFVYRVRNDAEEGTKNRKRVCK